MASSAEIPLILGRRAMSESSQTGRAASTYLVYARWERTVPTGEGASLPGFAAERRVLASRPTRRGRNDMAANSARLRRIVMALACVCAAAVAPISAAARSFRAADTQAEDYPTVQALGFMDKLIQERTGGRH